MDPRKKKFPGLLLPILWLVFGAGLLTFFITSQFLPAKEYRLAQEKSTTGAANYINDNNSSAPQRAKLQEKNTTPPLSEDENNTINFLLLGAAGEGNDAPDLTDTIILARWDKTQQKIFLFSFPRDLLIKIPGQTAFTKINALYAYNKKSAGHEFNDIKKTVEDISGLKIDHFVFVNLTAVKRIVDTLGGVNVMVKKDILDTQFPGPNHSYQTFEIKAGWRFLDGEGALKYMRTRHSVSGDFDRIERQQEVLQALKQKALALKPWNVIQLFELYSALSKNIKTDLGLWRIKAYWEQIQTISQDNIVKTKINQENLLQAQQINLGGEIASALAPKAGLDDYREIQKYIQNIIRN